MDATKLFTVITFDESAGVAAHYHVTARCPDDATRRCVRSRLTNLDVVIIATIEGAVTPHYPNDAEVNTCYAVDYPL